MTSLSRFQTQLLAAIPFLAAPLSFLGSSTILFIIFSKRGGQNTNTTYLRLMVGICTYDVLMTTWTMMGPIPVPKNDASDSIASLAHGSIASCTAQGFFIYLGAIGTLFYNCSMMVYYIASIVWEYSTEDLFKIEPYLHGISITLPLMMNVIGLYLQIFNPTLSAQRCGITAYPPACARDPSVPCTRGWHFNLYVMYAITVPCTIGLFFLLLSLLWIYVVVRRRSQSTVPSHQHQQQQQEPTYVVIPRHNPHPKYVRAVAVQSMVYSMVFFNTYFWVFARFFIRNSKNPAVVYLIRFLAELFLPLQGFCNAINFLRPRYNSIKKYHKEKSVLWLIKESILTKPRMIPSLQRRISQRFGSGSFRAGTAAAAATAAAARQRIQFNPSLEIINNVISEEKCPEETGNEDTYANSNNGTSPTVGTDHKAQIIMITPDKSLLEAQHHAVVPSCSYIHNSYHHPHHHDKNDDLSLVDTTLHNNLESKPDVQNFVMASVSSEDEQLEKSYSFSSSSAASSLSLSVSHQNCNPNNNNDETLSIHETNVMNIRETNVKGLLKILETNTIITNNEDDDYVYNA